MSFSFDPVAFVRGGAVEKADAPRQGRAAAHLEGRIEFVEGQRFEDALRDIEGFDYLWLIAVFDRADGWRPTVLPPRSDRKRGVFATRSPHRPNPIALSVVRLVRRQRLALEVAELDLLDGTPILDVKPYIAWSDAIVEGSAGWLERPADRGEHFHVRFDTTADMQLAFLDEHGESLRARIEDQLTIGPRPHAYRRIRAHGDGYVLAIRRWRVRFTLEGEVVTVLAIASSEKPKALVAGTADATHCAFVERFGLRTSTL
ncbi:MAG: tRNA (N6-threonylcarbamoyladenosine(37)-N6)-methyltransferase TrmO [Myxococcota bacterium]